MTPPKLIPQPHGGALLDGGVPGNAGGGNGSRITVPAAIVPENAAAIAAEQLPELVRMAAKLAKDRRQPKVERMRAAAFVHQVAGGGKLEDLPGAKKPRATVTVVSADQARKGDKTSDSTKPVPA